MMPDTLQSLLARPDLPRVARAINETLERERVRRAYFRRELTPSIKAEFIGGETVMHSPAKAKQLRTTMPTTASRSIGSSIATRRPSNNTVCATASTSWLRN